MRHSFLLQKETREVLKGPGEVDDWKWLKECKRRSSLGCDAGCSLQDPNAAVCVGRAFLRWSVVTRPPSRES